MPRKREQSETAFDTLQELLRRNAEKEGKLPEPKSEPDKLTARVKAGRKEGKKGGKTRAKKLPLAERAAIAKRAARARWQKQRSKS